MTTEPASSPASSHTVRPSTLWDSYTGTSSQVISVLFSQAANELATRGYDSYADQTENPEGITIRQALETVITQYISRAHHPANHNVFPTLIRDMLEEMERRLTGVLYILGTARSDRADEQLFSWTMSAAGWDRGRGLYHGQADAVRLLKLAAVMISAIETMRV